MAERVEIQVITPNSGDLTVPNESKRVVYTADSDGKLIAEVIEPLSNFVSKESLISPSDQAQILQST